eukprot:TRINITY_DN27861_c0_g3_i1.p1 TRINITY_DN27861_c0_g3~~TRINITY_DN27861_c0_g3_i1.p1  ORF type:complete len:1044 (-),score=327.68 TRINITY_DN27861_c0_g3_i1:165-3296(-)
MVQTIMAPETAAPILPTDPNKDEVVESKLGGPLGPSVLSWFKKRNGDTLRGALAFVPWVIQQAFFDGALSPEGAVVVHRGKGAVVLSDASGFTTLTEKVSKKSNGAELLSQCLANFFTPLVDLLNDYHGDVIKFSGNALTVYFPDVDDTKSVKYNKIVPPHGTYGLPDLGPMATAVLRASACSIEIHKRLNMFDTGVDGVCLCLKIGIGCGAVNILQVGGVVPPETHVKRYEYIIAGPPLEQISVAEKLAKNGETCLSPKAWEYVKDCVIEGSPLEDRPDFHLLLRMDESKYTFPTIKHAAKENDSRSEKQFKLSELNIIRQFTPSAVFRQIECGTLTYVNEMRYVSVVFVSGTGLDVMSDGGPAKVQRLVADVQTACYAHEGTMNKFLIDDKGLLFLLVWGLPPLVHTDDPCRAVLACFDMMKIFQQADLIGRFGITTSQTYCGVCGSARRMEYTVLGDSVNLAAKLMQQAPPHGLLCDESTKDRVGPEIVLNAMAPIRMRGKEEPTPLFQPVRKEQPSQTGLNSDGRIRFPWYENSDGGSGVSAQQLQVQQLCGLKEWSGIARVQEMLGGQFSKALHEGELVLQKGATLEKPVPGSPFADGGIVILQCPTGMGKVELAEHMVVHAAVRFGMLPIFGTMGPRPGDSVRLATELLRSTLGMLRFLTPGLPPDDGEALQLAIPQNLSGHAPLLRTALYDPQQAQTAKDKDKILDSAIDVVIGMLNSAIENVSVIITLQFESGTSLFPKTIEYDQKVFWSTVSKLAVPVKKSKKLAMMILCRDADRSNIAVQIATQNNCFLELEGLADEAIVDYLSNYMSVPTQILPAPLRSFVAKVTLGNPLYIRETIDAMLENGYVQVNRAANGAPRNVEVKDIDKINVAAWQHTSMVGGTVCQLEALDPLESAVLKMSTCFAGPFSLPDLAASSCSQWAGATFFDLLRLYKRLQSLVDKKIIDVVEEPDASEAPRGKRDAAFGSTQYFQTRSLLIRAVGSSMVLEQQKKSAKRQALVDRALSKELPARLEVLAQKKSTQHIPWYYEQAFRRM